jgi:hypothetical protein
LMMETKDKRVTKSPAGYLVKSIEDDYAAPRGFESKANRAKREEAERQQRQREAEAKRRQKEEQARDRATQTKVTEYWNGLGVAEQKKLDAEALEQADDSLVNSYREMVTNRNPLASTFLKLIRDAHIRNILNLPHPQPAEESPAPCADFEDLIG